MSVIDKLIRVEEGREHEAYCDPLTHAEPWTIGEGHTGREVHKGLVWTDAQIDAAKAADIATATRAAFHNCPWIASINEVRQAVVIAMFFQLGEARTLKFVHTLGAMRDQRWNDAAGGMRDSAWAKQTPKRVERMARALETGETQWA
jgi:lysozyme